MAQVQIYVVLDTWSNKSTFQLYNMALFGANVFLSVVCPGHDPDEEQQQMYFVGF